MWALLWAETCKVNHRPSWPVWSKAPTISWNDGDPSYTPDRIAYTYPLAIESHQSRNERVGARLCNSIDHNKSPWWAPQRFLGQKGLHSRFSHPLPVDCSASQVAKRFFLLGMSGMRWTSRGSANSQVLRFRSAYSHFDKPDYGRTPLDCKRKMVVWVIHYQRRV